MIQNVRRRAAWFLTNPVTRLGCRQKQHMVQLEQRLRDSELQVHGALLGRGAPYADVCMLRLQVGGVRLAGRDGDGEGGV